jgi:bacillopeptidase F (M6 metalloprotease family)
MSAINFSSALGAEIAGGIVTKTLDTFNNTSSSSGASAAETAAPFDKQTFGAAVVDKTLDYMNSGTGSSSSTASDMSQTYQFSKDVLGAYATGIGTLADADA